MLTSIYINIKNMQRIPVIDALKEWFGEKYENSDYEKYIRLKQLRCNAMFSLMANDSLIGILGSGYKESNDIDFNNDTISEQFLNNCIKQKNEMICTAGKIKFIFNDNDAEKNINNLNDNTFLSIPNYEGDYITIEYI